MYAKCILSAGVQIYLLVCAVHTLRGTSVTVQLYTHYKVYQYLNQSVH